MPLLILGFLAVSIVVQLIPLPPALWMNLPGHDLYAEAATASGMPQPWRPISISPDLTLNSLVSLTIPLAILIGVASLAPSQFRLVLPFVLGAVVLSALLGMAQISSGARSGLYLYKVTNEGQAVGFFSNRNHQAALLACALPMLAIWSTLPAVNNDVNRAKPFVAAALGVFLLPMIAITGSRTGLILGGVGLASSFGLLWLHHRKDLRQSKWRRVTFAAPWALALIVLIVAIALSRATAVQRLFSTAYSEDSRVANLPLLINIMKDFFPVGSGYGTFDPLFRRFEPYEHLTLKYLNHAHNDLLELVMTGGVLAVLALLSFLVWFAARTWRVFRSGIARQTARMAALGSCIIAIMLLASLTDYPLRTPLSMALFAIACSWLCSHSSGEQGDADGAARKRLRSLPASD